jgi:hypothetical protein
MFPGWWLPLYLHFVFFLICAPILSYPFLVFCSRKDRFLTKEILKNLEKK